jgi:hypothetical protein
MPLIVKLPRQWAETDRKTLPDLRKPEHSSGYAPLGDWRPLPRCEHGVYLSEDFDVEFDGEGNAIAALAPYCYVCYPLEKNSRKPRKLIIARPLEPGEYRLKDGKLFDRRPVYTEIFTKGGQDLRLQKDYETGKRKLETMGGYVAKERGYGRAGRGHGPDSDADDIRMSWLSGHEGSPVGHADPEIKSSDDGWTATLPSVCPPDDYPDWLSFWGWQGITEKNWQSYSFPMLQGAVHTNLRTGLGLTEGDFFGDQRQNRMHPDTMRSLILWGQNKRHQQLKIQKAQSFLEERIPNPKYVIADRRMPDSSRAVSFITFYVPIERKNGRVSFRHHPPIYPMQPAPRPEFPNLDGWHSPLEWVRCSGVWRCRFRSPAPSTRQLAAWRNKPEYQRTSVHRIPLRRTKRWSDDWRTERPMRDLATRLKKRKKHETETTVR